MGTQIAVQCANHGRLVFLYDSIRAAVEQAPARLERLAQDLAGKGLLRSSSSRDTLRRIELGNRHGGRCCAGCHCHRMRAGEFRT